MTFDINRYRPKKKRRFWKVLCLRYKLYKRRNKRKWKEYDKKLGKQEAQNNNILKEEKNKNYLIGAVCAFIFFPLLGVIDTFLPQWWDKNADFIMGIVLGIGVIIIQGVLWLIGIIIAGILIQLLYHGLIFILSSFIAKLLDEIDIKRQVKTENALSRALDNALEDIELYKERALEEIKDNRYV